MMLPLGSANLLSYINRDHSAHLHRYNGFRSSVAQTAPANRGDAGRLPQAKSRLHETSTSGSTPAPEPGRGTGDVQSSATTPRGHTGMPPHFFCFSFLSMHAPPLLYTTACVMRSHASSRCFADQEGACQKAAVSLLLHFSSSNTAAV